LDGTFVLEPLFILLVVAHLAAVNLASAGPLVSLALEWDATRRGSAAGEAVARRLSLHAFVAFFVGIAIGSVFFALLWRQEGNPFVGAVSRFSSAKLWFAAAELAFYAVCQGLYVYMWRWHRAKLGRGMHRALAVLAATNLLYHFPPMMVAIGEIAAGQLDAPAAIDAATYRELVYSPQVLSRSVHHILAAIALAGLYAAMLGWRLTLRTTDNETTVREATRAAAWGARISLGVTVLQVPVGIWVLLAAPNNRAVMGDDLMATGLFVIAVVAALGLMQHLAAIAFGEVTRKTIATAAGLYVFVVLAMTATMVMSRG
jgi:hypothetical protein